MKALKTDRKSFLRLKTFAKVVCLFFFSIFLLWFFVGTIIAVLFWKNLGEHLSFQQKITAIYLGIPTTLAINGRCLVDDQIFAWKIKQIPQVSSVSMNPDECHHNAVVNLKEGGKIVFIDVREDQFAGTKNLFFLIGKKYFEPLVWREKYVEDIKKWNEPRMLEKESSFGVFPEKLKTIRDVIDHYDQLNKIEVKKDVVQVDDKDYYFSFVEREN